MKYPITTNGIGIGIGIGKVIFQAKLCIELIPSFHDIPHSRPNRQRRFFSDM